LEEFHKLPKLHFFEIGQDRTTEFIKKLLEKLLDKAEKTKVTIELNERKELLNTRVAVLGKQEERMRIASGYVSNRR
jgi:chaperonin cofactor prefoldin